MKIHEYQAKRLLKAHGIPVPRGSVAFTPAEAEAAARFLGGSSWAVKAQICAGGRGEAGGVKLVRALPEVKTTAEALLGRRLVTRQTAREGLPVKRLYIEEGLRAARELYLAAHIDRSRGRVAILGSSAGGATIEQRGARKPDALLTLAGDPKSGPRSGPRSSVADDDVFRFASRMGGGSGCEAAVAKIVVALARAFLALDASLIELNPLAILEDGRPIALDARVMLDDNALFRHPELVPLRDEDESAPIELEAARHEINFVALDGSVGCVVNGAGLGMATLDLLKICGIEPANFMDIRPVATRDQIARGFHLLFDRPGLKCLLVNVFGGGIMRCDLVAEAMVLATRKRPPRIPIVVRFAGTNAGLGRRLLENSALRANFAEGLADAVARVGRIVGAAGGAGRIPSRAVARLT